MKFFRLPFASQLQIALLIGMLLGFVLIGQSISLEVYKWGMIILMLSAFLQIVVGNIPPETQIIGTLVRLALGLGQRPEESQDGAVGGDCLRQCHVSGGAALGLPGEPQVVLRCAEPRIMSAQCPAHSSNLARRMAKGHAGTVVSYRS